MRTAQVCPTCATYTNALCVIYNGEFLQNINVAPLDNLEDILMNINDNLIPIHGVGSPSSNATYIGQIYIDDNTGDVYIADSTGGGSGDWEQLALMTAIPATPGLQDVLSVNNTSTGYDLNIENGAVRVYNTGVINNVVLDGTTGTIQLITGNGDANIKATNVSTTRNHELPDGNGTYVLSVNGNFANNAGDVTVPSIPYKTYVAIISQSGTSAPSANFVLENTLSNPVTFSYTATGVYRINCADFDLPNTVVFFQQGAGAGGCTFQLPVATGYITLVAYNSSASTQDGLFNDSHIEIRVYS